MIQRRMAGLVLPVMAALLLAACQGSASPPPSDAPASSADPATPDASDPSPSAEPGTAAPGGLSSDPLHTVVLRDVTNDTEFTLGQLAAEKPVILETMAYWCTTCEQQQRAFVEAHTLADFHSVSLDIDPNENAHTLAEYAADRDFDWAFAMANGELIQQLRQRFGTVVTIPPATPKILLRPDGSVELFGVNEVMSPEQVAEVVSGG